MLNLSLSLLEKHDIDLVGELPAAELGLEDTADETFAPVAYALHASRVGGGVLVRGSASTRVAGPCSRCLEPSEILLAAPEVCQFHEEPAGETLDLAPQLREDLLVNLPLKRLCRDDCRGLCTVCGGNRNRRRCRCSVPAIEQGIWDGLDSIAKS
jgi:uncharacterized metal-binding protein YceD (DUF177 family)